MEKKDDFLNKKIEEETQKAKNALLTGGTNGKATATAALRRKKTHEAELEKLYGMRATIEAQVSWSRLAWHPACTLCNARC